MNCWPSSSKVPVTTVPYTLWDELRVKLSSVGIGERVLQDAKESLDLTGAFKIPEFPLSGDQLAQLGL